MAKKNLSKKSVRRAVSKALKPKRRSMVSKVKSVLYKIAETKQAALTNQPGTNVYHNISDRLVSNLMAVSQGVNDTLSATASSNTNRIGDAIQPISSTIYLQFRQPADRPNVTWRIFILKFGGGAVPPTSIPSKNITGNLMIDPVDTERCSVIKIRTFKAPDNYWTGSLAASKEFCFFRKLHIRYPKRKYNYLADNSGQGKFWNYAMYCAAYDTTGTLITDNIGTVQFNSILNFKDI